MDSYPRPADTQREPQRLYTAEQASQQLQVPASWLRKKASARCIPCTFIGKHLRFSAANIDAIVHDGHIDPTSQPRT